MYIGAGVVNPTNTSAIYFHVGTGTVSRMTIANSGNVGIGTNTPSERLHVNGNVLIETNLIATGISKIILPASTNGLTTGILWNDAGTIRVMP